MHGGGIIENSNKFSVFAKKACFFFCIILVLACVVMGRLWALGAITGAGMDSFHATETPVHLDFGLPERRKWRQCSFLELAYLKSDSNTLLLVLSWASDPSKQGSP